MHTENIGINIKNNAKDVLDQIKSIDKELSRLKSQRVTVELNASKLSETKKSIQAVDTAMLKLRQQKAEIKISDEPADVAKAKIKEVNRALDILSNRKAELRIEANDLKGADTQLRKIDSEMARLNNRKALLQVDGSSITANEHEARELSNTLESLSSKKYSINISSNLEKISGMANSASNKIFSAFNPLTSKLNNMLGLGLAFKAIDTGVNMITGSIDSAISRVDTMNNSVRSFQNMKFSDSDIERVLGKNGSLSKSIDGLPTRLDAATANVQMLASSTRDLDLSKDIFKAVNDGVLTFGGNAENVSSVVTQLSKSFSSGKIQGEVFASMLDNNMGPVLTEIAKRMGKTMAEMQEGLSDGTISVEEFQKALIDVDKNGSDSLNSLESAVKDATKGLRTSISNMNASVVRGMGEVINSFNNILSDAGLNGFSGLFKSIGDAFESGLKTVSKLIEENKDSIITFFQTVSKTISKIDVGAFFSGLIDGLKGVVVQMKAFAAVAKPFVNWLGKIATFIGGGSLEKGIGRIAGGLLSLAVGLKAFSIATKGLSKITKLFGGLSKLKMPLFGRKKGGSSGGGISSMAKPMESLKSVGTSFVKNAGSLALVYGAIKIVEEAAEAMKQLDEKIPDDFTGLARKIASMSLAIGAMGGLAFIASKMNFGDSLKGITTIAFIAADLVVASIALEKINEKVSDDIGNISKKIANITIAIVAMGGLVAIAGVIAKIQPAIVIAGLVTVALISAELIVAAIALKKINEKVPSDLGEVAKKMGSIAIAIGSMVLIVGAIGALMATGIGAVIAGAGLISVALLAAELMLVARAIDQLNKKVPSDIETVVSKIDAMEKVLSAIAESTLGKISTLAKGIIGVFSAATFNKIIDDLIEISTRLKAFDESFSGINAASVETNMKSVQEVLKVLTGQESLFKKLGNLFKGKVDDKSLKESLKMLNSINSIADELSKLETLDLDSEGLKTTITSVTEVVSYLATDKGLLQGLKNLVKMKIDSKALQNSFEIITTISELNNKLKSIQKMEFNKEAVKITIGAVQQVMESLSSDKSILSSFVSLAKIKIDNSVMSNVLKTIDLIQQVNNKLKNIELMGFNKEAVLITIGAVQDVLDEFTGSDNIITSLISLAQLKIDTEILKKATETIDAIQQVNNKLKNIELMGFNKEAVLITIGAIMDVTDEFTRPEGIVSSLFTLAQIKIDLETLKNAFNVIDALNNLNSKFKSIELLGFSKEAVLITVNAIKDVVNELSISEGIVSGLMKFGKVKISEESMKNAENLVDTISNLNEKIKSIELLKFTKENVLITIGGIQDVLDAITKDNIFVTALQSFNKSLKEDDLNNAINMVDSLVAINNNLVNLNNTRLPYDEVEKTVKALKKIIAIITSVELFGDSFTDNNENLKKSNDMTIKMKTLATSIAQLQGQLFDEELVNKNIEAASRVVKKINEFPSGEGVENISGLITNFKNLISTLKGLEGKFNPIGKGYGVQMLNGFNSVNVPEKIKKSIDNLIVALGNKKSQFYNTGQSYGQAMKDGFARGLENMDKMIDGYVRTMGNKIMDIQTMLNNLKAPSLTVDVTENVRTTRSRSLPIQGPQAQSPSRDRRNVTRPEYHANGGMVGTSLRTRGTDSIATMLTRGEFVQNRKAVKYFGTDFMHMINNLDLGGALHALSTGYATGQATNSIVNHYFNNTKNIKNSNATVNQNIQLGSTSNYANMRANRYMNRRGG